jgi:hypothetical protein
MRFERLEFDKIVGMTGFVLSMLFILLIVSH